ATAVNAPGALRAVRKVGLLVHGQGVHVGPQPDAAPARAAALEHAHHPGLADAAMDLDAPGSELFGHDAGGAALLEADLRMGMEVAPDRDEFVGEFGDAVERRHAGPFRADGARNGAWAGAAIVSSSGLAR